MQLRRPIAALMTALALFGGGATMTACEAAGQDQNDGTTDSDDAPDTETNQESDPSNDNPPNVSDPSGGAGEDQDDDSQDPD